MIELTTSALMLFSIFYGGATLSPEKIDQKFSRPSQIIEDKNIVDGTALLASVGNSRTAEGSVREYFSDTPILVEIARCESQFKHVGKNGKIIRGEIDSADLGVMQINKYFHGDEAEKLGLDITTLNGNMAYAKQLYEKEGTVPWQSSSECWNRRAPLSKV